MCWFLFLLWPYIQYFLLNNFLLMDICFSLCCYTTFLRFFYVAFSDFSIVIFDYLFNVSSATIANFDAVEDFA